MAKKPLSLLLLESLAAFLFMMLLLLQRVNSKQGLSFYFDEFTVDSNLILQGDATYTQDNTLRLTKVDENQEPTYYSVGRALYSNPIKLYDISTGFLPSFKTTFEFSITASDQSIPADGLAFFIASANTTIPPASSGQYLGLFSGENPINHSSRKTRLTRFKEPSDEDQVFAIEFDTFPNKDIDPPYRHIGVDVNNIRSVITEKWDWKNGGTATATITYSSHDKLLYVVASYPNEEEKEISTNEVDLTTVLPEWVRVGFSASTGELTQVNTVFNWSFKIDWDKNDVAKHHLARIASVV